MSGNERDYRLIIDKETGNSVTEWLTPQPQGTCSRIYQVTGGLGTVVKDEEAPSGCDPVQIEVGVQ
jgi:hypothetical protein